MWVVGQYAGTQAKRVIALADEGLGYYILENAGGHRNPVILAAFRLLDGTLLPHHIDEVKDPRKIKKYETLRRQRHGLKEEPENIADIVQNLDFSEPAKEQAEAVEYDG